MYYCHIEHIYLLVHEDQKHVFLYFLHYQFEHETHYFLNYLHQRNLVDITVHIIPFIFSCNSSEVSYLQEQTISYLEVWPSSLKLVIFRLDSDCFPVVLSFFVYDLSFSSV